MPDAQNNREGSQARKPFKCLNGRAMEKDWPKRPSDPQLQEAPKNSLITPVMEAVPAPAHLALPGSLKAKQVCHLYAQLSLGQSCHRQKKVLHLCTQGHFGSVRLFATLQTVACQASQSGRWALQARILEPIGQYWLPYPSRALYFLLP